MKSRNAVVLIITTVAIKTNKKNNNDDDDCDENNHNKEKQQNTNNKNNNNNNNNSHNENNNKIINIPHATDSVRTRGYRQNQDEKHAGGGHSGRVRLLLLLYDRDRRQNKRHISFGNGTNRTGADGRKREEQVGVHVYRRVL